MGAAVNHLHHYVVVRRDIPFGKQLVHAVHAAGESFYKFPRSSETAERARGGEDGGSNPSGGAINISLTHAVVLGAELEQLDELEARLIAAGVDHVAIREMGGAYDGQLVSIGAVPFIRTPELRELFKEYRCVL